MKNKKRIILALSSLPAQGNVGLNVMKSILGTSLHCIPTTLLSGVASSEKVAIQTIDIKPILDKFLQNAFHENKKVVLVTGFFSTVSQVIAVRELIIKYRKTIDKVIIDPVCGDHGKAYVPKEIINALPDLLINADIIFPNTTEIEFLTGTSLAKATESFQSTYTASLAITGCEEGENIGVKLMHNDLYVFHSAQKTKGKFFGTGDALVGFFVYFHILKGQTINNAIQLSVKVLHSKIQEAALVGKQQISISTKWENYST